MAKNTGKLQSNNGFGYPQKGLFLNLPFLDSMAYYIESEQVIFVKSLQEYAFSKRTQTIGLRGKHASL